MNEASGVLLPWNEDLALTWLLTVSLFRWCIGHWATLWGPGTAVLEDTGSSKSSQVLSSRYHQCWSGYTGIGSRARMLRKVTQPRVIFW